MTHDRTPTTSRAWTRRLSMALAAMLALPSTLAVGATFGPSASADVPPILDRDSQLVTNDPLPTVQIDGIVWDQAVVGDTVYVVGDFDSARPAGSPAGTNEVPRSNILAYDITTGELIDGFAPALNRQAMAVTSSPDGSRIYVGGEFTQANGVNRYRLAALDAQTGALINSFFPIVDYRVGAIWATDTTVYAGGKFSKVGNGLSASRQNLAAFDASTGGVLPWAPTADAEVLDMLLTPDGSKMVLAGRFLEVNGAEAYGMGAVDPATGDTLPWPANQVVRNAGEKSAITTLKTDGTSVFGTGYHFGEGGNVEGSFSMDQAGNVNWVQACNGDTHDVEPMNGYVYTVSHVHYCGNVGGFPQSSPWRINQRHALAFTADARGTNRRDPWGYYNWMGTPAPANAQWFPEWGVGDVAGQAGWTVESNDTYVVIGGEFKTVNGAQQQGLVRFAAKPVAPGADGPRLGGGSFTPNVRSTSPGQVRVSVPANYDRDDHILNYRIYRNNTLVHEVDVASTYWNRPIVGFTDTGLAPGSTPQYRVRTEDGDGNVMWGSAVPVTVAASGDPSTYADAVMADGGRVHWRLGEGAGSTTARDELGFQDATVGGGVQLAKSGALLNETDTAAKFNGRSSGLVSDSTKTDAQDVFSVEAWFKTTSGSGGYIYGYGNSRTGQSSKMDRVLYLTDDGAVTFGVVNGSKKTVASEPGQNDGQWHHVVGTVGDDGMHLYLDGVRAASRGDAMGGQANNGYWRVGYDNLDGWPDKPASNGLNGFIDEAALYLSVLTADQVAGHYASSGRTAELPDPPADAYGAAVHGSDPYLYYRLSEGSGTTAADAGIRGNDGDYVGTVGRGSAGRIAGDAAATFDGSGFVASRTEVYNPSSYSVAAWFKTTTTDGGTIIGFGSSRSGDSDTADRQVYIRDDGRVAFRSLSATGIGESVAESPGTYNDGEWHLVVATQGSEGMRLYLDGNLAATAPQTMSRAFTGYWRVGRDSTGGGSSGSGLSGTIDEAAVYDRVLSGEEIAQQYTLGSGGLPPQPPSASFTHLVDDLNASFDGSGSSDPDGSVVSWSWDFGDGATATGPTAAHTYVAPGTYTVTLTVTDDDGATAQSSQQVIAVANLAPSAAIVAEVSGLSATLDGTGSSDSDGSVVSWSWDFGDGNTASGPTAAHTYAADGTYTVALTVTDDDGATAQTSQDLTVVTPVDPVAVAADAFDRTVSGGFGEADTGGTWTVFGSSSRYSVQDGTGRHLLDVPGRTTNSLLGSVSATDVSAGVDISFDKVATGGGIYSHLSVRSVGTNEYRLRLRAMPTATTLTLSRVVGGTETRLADILVPGLVYAPGQVWRLELDAIGTDPTTLSARLWDTAGSRPVLPLVSVTDSTAQLQVPGAVGLINYLSGSATNAPVTVMYDNFLAVEN